MSSSRVVIRSRRCPVLPVEGSSNEIVPDGARCNHARGPSIWISQIAWLFISNTPRGMRETTARYHVQIDRCGHHLYEKYRSKMYKRNGHVAARFLASFAAPRLLWPAPVHPNDNIQVQVRYSSSTRSIATMVPEPFHVWRYFDPWQHTSIISSGRGRRRTFCPRIIVFYTITTI